MIHVGTLTHPSLILDVTQSHTQKRMNNAVVKHLLPATIWQDIERLMNHTSPICFAHTGENYNSLDSHIKSKHKDSGMICETCQRSFRDNYALRRHRQSHEGTSTMEMCTKCYGVFKHLKNHFINCKAPKTKNFKCGICNVSFLREKNLSMHIKRKHTSPKLYPCGCGKSFLYPFSVKRHSKTCKQAE